MTAKELLKSTVHGNAFGKPVLLCTIVLWAGKLRSGRLVITRLAAACLTVRLLTILGILIP